MPWSTPELQANTKKKNQLLYDYHTTRNQSLKKKADENQNKITIMKRKLKKDFTVNSLEEAGTDPAKLWQLYNLLILLVFDKDLDKLKEKVENVINVAQSWYNKNGMKNNSSKSEILVISTKKSDNIKIDVLEEGILKVVKSKKSIKILGVHIDKTLSWSKQIGIVKKKCH